MKTQINANDNYYHLWFYLCVGINMLSEPLEYKLGFIETCYARRYSCEHLSKRYKDVVAVNNINFAIQKGYCFGLPGPKGAGKTTAIEIMKSIIKVSKGQVFYYAKPSMSRYLKKLACQFSRPLCKTLLRLKKP